MKNKKVKIVENLECHEGYLSEELKIISIEENDYFIVENEKGTQWFVGEEEIETIN